MQVRKSRSYQYVKVGAANVYYCLQQNLIVLAWGHYVAIKKRHITPLNLKQQVRHNVYYVKAAFKFFRTIASYKYRSRRIDAVINVPSLGHSCIPVHRGYKVFHPLRKVVVKIFDAEVDTVSISNEIERLKTISELEFAPSIRRWNIAQRWYEEDYIFGSSEFSKVPPDSSTLLKGFRDEIVQHLRNLILFKRPIEKDPIEYVTELIKATEIDMLSANIKNFLHAMAATVSAGRVPHVFLVLTHGDFCPGNILNTPSGKKLVDWESVSYRSALFDVYSYFISRRVVRDVPIASVISEIQSAIPVIASRLAREAPELVDSIMRFERTYRRIFYIERICMLIDRTATDRRLDIVGHIKRYIEIFNSYEELERGAAKSSRSIHGGN